MLIKKGSKTLIKVHWMVGWLGHMSSHTQWTLPHMQHLPTSLETNVTLDGI